MNPDFKSLEIIVIILILLLVVIIILLALKILDQEKSKNLMEQRLYELESNINKVELENIESKLNPHLFKNILNSIQSHAYQTYYSLDKLSSVLEYLLYESRSDYVTPKDEIGFIKDLMEINKVKLSPLFDLRLKLKINENEPLYSQKLLAPLISVDLIENAFKYADVKSPDAFISVIVEFSDKIFSLTVANTISSKPPIKKEKSGIGIASLEKRLRIIYKENYKLERFIEENVYIAQLKINLFEYKAKMLAAR